jgi:hypothetical protein
LIDSGTSFLQSIDNAGSCDKATAIATAGAYYYQYKPPAVAATVAESSTKLAKRFAGFAVVLGAAKAFGIC